MRHSDPLRHGVEPHVERRGAASRRAATTELTELEAGRGGKRLGADRQPVEDSLMGSGFILDLYF